MDLLKTGLLDGNPLEVQGTTYDSFPVSPLLIVPEVITPSLELNFATGKQLDSRITFTRASSGTFINSSGLVESASTNVARFTHDPVTLASLGLLIEESRTNLLLRSQEIGSSPWLVQGSATATINQGTAPDGTNTASLVTLTSSNVSAVYQNNVNSTGGTYILSVWVRTLSGTANFTMSSYSATDGQANSSPFTATTTWQRFTWTRTVTVASNWYPLITNTTSGGTFLAWGVQLEAGAFATSYIPTTSATATRAADVATMTGTNFSSWYRQDEGTLVADYASTGTTATKFFMIAAYDGGSNNSLIGLLDGSSRTYNVYTPSFVLQVGLSTTLPTSQQKAAIAYKLNDFAVSFAGASAQTDTSGSLPTLATLYIGNGPNSGQQAAGTISRIRYYRRRLPNANLQSLTT